MFLLALLPALAAAAPPPVYTCVGGATDAIPPFPTFPLTIEVLSATAGMNCIWLVPSQGGQLTATLVPGSLQKFLNAPANIFKYSGAVGGVSQAVQAPAGTSTANLPPLGPLDLGASLTVQWKTSVLGGHFQLTVSCTGCASLGGDPHFRGLGGQKYLINGEPGTVYNIISTPSLLVNALFGTAIGPHHMTVMQELGIVVGTDTVFANKYNRLQLNGVAAPASAVLSDGVSTLTRDINKTGDGITLRTPEFFLRWIPRGYEIDLLDASLLRTGDASVHGLLGQTWNSAKWPASSLTTEITDAAVLFPALLDGSGESDYAVRDGLFGHEFGFSTFDSAAYPEVHAVPAVSKAGRKTD